MNLFGKVMLGLAGGALFLGGIGWMGLQIKPSNLPLPTATPDDLGKFSLPNTLPAPVRRYYIATIGEEVPRIESLVVYGRGRAYFGIWMPLRYQLVHRPGYEFERYMEVTWFGLPVLNAIDRYTDGVGMTGPIGKEATGPAVDQGANMILWVEAPLMPSLWITDPRIRWEAIDETAARLFFPFGEKEDELIVYFDPESDLITSITALRYRDETTGKIQWRADFLAWQTKGDITLPSRIAITWADQGEPWSFWDLEKYYWNVDISKTFADSAEDPINLGNMEAKPL